MSLDAVIQKIPKPVLIIGVLVLALVFFVYNDPLKDECEVQIATFKKNTSGLLYVDKIGKKTQFPQINYWRDRCRQGNSIGSCEDYLEGLRVIVRELKNINSGCQIKFKEAEPGLLIQISNAVQIVALVAWGEKPPAGLSERLGWLNESHVRTFCYLKDTFLRLSQEKEFYSLREKVYREYPGEWPEKFDVNSLVAASGTPGGTQTRGDEEIDVSKLLAENRPRAYKTASNPAGTLTKEQIYERSLFSIRCDLYM